MLKLKKIAVFCLLFIVVGAVYVASAIKVQVFRDRLDPTHSISALLVRPEVLEIASGEFRLLLADYLLLKASVFLGGRYTSASSDKEAVATLFRQSVILDPYFFQTCYYIQSFLPWSWHMTEEAIELLEISKQHRYWDWNPGFFIGFDYYYFLDDNLTASRYLMEASRKPGALPFLGLLGARLSQQGGQTGASIAFLRTMYDRTEREEVKKEIERRIKALEGVLTLEKGVSRFMSIFGHPPETLGQLVETGILERLPENPVQRDKAYIYSGGKIEF